MERERGFLTPKGSPIINSDLIHKLLEAALLPKKAAVLHGRGHQKGSLISAYNNATDQKAKEIVLSHPSLQSPVILALTPSDSPTTREILSHPHSLFHPSSKTLRQFLHKYFPISITLPAPVRRVNVLIPIPTLNLHPFQPIKYETASQHRIGG